ncbi:MAG: type II secretion system F family protein [Patescibacteria group bacterium]
MNNLSHSIRHRLSIKEQTLFAKRLSFLITAGVPLLESLHLLRKQTKSKSRGKMLDVVIGDVSQGQYLSTSLGRFGNVFGLFAVNIIRIGETSGILSQNLNYLADELRKKQVLRKKVLSALLYPLLITLATLGITAMLTVYIFPKILPIFNSLRVSLPIYTRVLIAISAFLQAWGLILIITCTLLSIAIIILIREVQRAHIIADSILLTMPLAGTIARDYNLVTICRTLGLLLKSGILVIEAITITANTTTNQVYKNSLLSIIGNIKAGEKISQNLAQFPRLYPDIVTDMIAIGETTGKLSETLIYLSEHFESEVDDLTKNFSNTIEPVLMIFMGIVVGFVAISVITPIYAVSQSLTH